MKKMHKIKSKKDIRKALDKECLSIWGKIVRTRDRHTCRLCGRRGNQPHHIYTKSIHSLRFDSKNGICLCSNHHTLSKDISGHKAPYEFRQWLDKELGEAHINYLIIKKRNRFKADVSSLQILKLELEKELMVYSVARRIVKEE